MKLAWLTDIHLNFLEKEERVEYYSEILSKNCDAVLITGDIAEAPSVTEILKEMAAHIQKPIYFVLGNHDYYRGQVDEVRQRLAKASQTHSYLFWLSTSGIQILNKDTILLGQDGWADGRLGDYANSEVRLNDSRLIVDLFQAKILGKFELLKKMQELADKDALALERDIYEAVKKSPKKIIVLTHVPPFKENCMHEGEYSDQNWTPYFSSKVIGDVLTKAASENSTIEFLVLCGHTHTKAEYKPLNNLLVRAGSAEYYSPEVNDVIFL